MASLRLIRTATYPLLPPRQRGTHYLLLSRCRWLSSSADQQQHDCHPSPGFTKRTNNRCYKQTTHHLSSNSVFFSTSSPDDKKPATSSPPPAPTNTNTFVDHLPKDMQPYAKLARMDKPWGSMLLLWPCFWSTALAADYGCYPDMQLLGLFTVGAFVMRGAGCTINDMWDAKYDSRVERTKTRPLASGELTHTQATVFLAAQLSIGLGVLSSLPHTLYCIKWGMASMPLVIAYPLMKRYTNWPQLVLGMTFNWGAFMGWAAVHGDLDWRVILPLYGSGVTWTIVYDTIYAHQDRIDDAKLNLKSTALHFGSNTKPILHTFSALTLLGWTLAGYGAGFVAPIYYAGSSLAWSHLTWQVHTMDVNDSKNLLQRFKSNQQLGAIVFCSCVAGNMAMGGVI
eukprot:CAMPEP_0195526236 /NCGR_PEP_ID=MMETSP0794_2-20130614/27175_1 /TAXON_ID=515487 /ORGANISM="Stephanopyxis turris, Strain CCMP 815" /LENGTH=396 /DNA_ID=CAMNT_0040656869 /DNA_START=51 /DNA_END=1241 /DNA_ORIENTATION=-